MTVRAHVVLPEELIEDIDRLAGKRKRSQFFEAAVREKLARERQSAALRESAGVLDPRDYPEWSTPEKVLAWIRESRRQDDARLDRLLKRIPE